MKKLLYPSSFILTAFLILYSCSPDEETEAPTSTVQSTTPEPEAETPEPVVVQYTLTVTASEGGTVSNEGGTYDEGTEIAVSASAADGYKFTGWSDGNNLIERQITVNEDIVLEANFDLKYSSYNLNINHPQKDEIFKNLSISSNSNVILRKMAFSI